MGPMTRFTLEMDRAVFHPLVPQGGAGDSSAISVADFNGDSHWDVLIGVDNNPDIILTGNGDGTFNAASDLDSSDSFYTRGFAIADFNEDGKLDIVVGTEGAAVENHIYLGN